jgi:glycosyltransferase involved in cell wall biosynthesis
MRMCAAMARAGLSPRLIAKRSPEPSELADHAFYGVEPSFPVDKLPYPQWRHGGGTVFTLAMVRELLARRSSTDLVYGREVVCAFAAAELGMPVVLELHAVPEPGLVRTLSRRIIHHRSLRGLVLISEALRRDMTAEGLVPKNGKPVIVAHDAADPPGELPAQRPSTGRPRVGYVGNLYAGRGVELVVELAGHLPGCDIEVIGGTEADLAHWRSQSLAPNLTFVGFVPPGQLRERYRSFDVLLMPHSRLGVRGAVGPSDISKWTSPMKMFEYMAAGVPIVASDLPVLGEILTHERNALIAPSGDVPAWQTAVQRLVSDRALARKLAMQAYEDLIAHHTWDARVRHIFAALDTNADARAS